MASDRYRIVGAKGSRQKNDTRKPAREGSPPVAASPMGRCTIGSDGQDGTLGGVFRYSFNPPVGVKCRHVLSSECQSFYWPTPPVRLPEQEFAADCPDAAFIRVGSPCFAGDIGEELNVLPATQSGIELAAQRRTKVQLNRRPTVNGVILFGAVSGFRLGSHFYRGPHFEVAPYFARILGITWPLRRRFSKAGDSGSWIIDLKTRQWFGMLVGGFDPPNTVSVAISAEHLVDAFNRYQISRNPGLGNSGLIMTMSTFAR